jgi:hypothetical protein
MESPANQSQQTWQGAVDGQTRDAALGMAETANKGGTLWLSLNARNAQKKLAVTPLSAPNAAKLCGSLHGHFWERSSSGDLSCSTS